jgi:hypothetical protein
MWQTIFLLLNPLFTLSIVLYVIGHWSGWFQLAKKYPEKAVYHGDWESFQSVSLQGISFNRCVHIGISAEALFLRPCFPFNRLFAPLEIPWSAVNSATRREVFWIKMIRIRLHEPDVTIQLKEENLQRARPYLPLDAV